MATAPQRNVFDNRSCFSFIGRGEAQEGNLPAPVKLPRQDLKETEDILTSGLSTLTLQERTEALHDVHCVGEELHETPEIIQKALADFDQAIQEERNPIYAIAANQNKAYVENPSFRLKFLRANMFDIDRSLRQIMNFLKHKATYFGVDKLARDLTLDDLNEDDLKQLSSGLYHIQDGRDRMGRVILHMFSKMLCQCKAETLVRVAHYIWVNVLLPIEDVQTKGITTIYYDVRAKPGEKVEKPGINFLLTALGPLHSLPVRYSAMHYCLLTTENDLALNSAILKITAPSFTLYSRVRSRMHFGSDLELQYQLRGHGIPLDTFPVDVNGNVREDILQKWFLKHREDEAVKAASLMAPLADRLDPSAGLDMDTSGGGIAGGATFNPPSVAGRTVQATERNILFGRGRKSQDHPGNVRFRELLEEHCDEYDKSPRHERQRIATDFTRSLAAQGIRFLQQTEAGEWVECDFSEGRNKVSQLFRTIRKRKTIRER